MALDAKSSAEPGVPNGQFLGLEVPLEQAKAVVLPVPWDVTTSYRPGTVRGPEAVIDASVQVDLFHPQYPEVWNLPLATLPVSKKWRENSRKLRKKSEKYISWLENGRPKKQAAAMKPILESINKASRELNDWVYQESKSLLARGQKPLLLGGDHSTPEGLIKALAEKHKGLSILHLDAHADLREEYEGFKGSHASIMNNALKHYEVSKLVQVGIRDVSQLERDQIEKDSRIKTFFDWDLKARLFKGESWDRITDEIIESLGPKVYLSFDIDGLDPVLCPSTGTPVPGGLQFYEALHLISKIRSSGREFVGGDLVEVAPGKTEWDAIVGARVLFQIAVQLLRP